MSPATRLLDRLLAEADTALRVVAAPARPARPNPAAGVRVQALAPTDRLHSARLMRVNHAGEIAAQALYRGQAAVARSDALRRALRAAAAEEHDHLAWCAQRIGDLGGRTSRLGPLWYAGSFAIGALAALGGDRLSLGFLAETEAQVARHLDGHLGRLPPGDTASRAIVAQMQADEAEHRADALRRGGAPLPGPARRLMRAAARIMTTLAYRL